MSESVLLCCLGRDWACSHSVVLLRQPHLVWWQTNLEWKNGTLARRTDARAHTHTPAHRLSPPSQNHTHVLVEHLLSLSSISKLAITLAVKTNRQHLNCTSLAFLSGCSCGVYNRNASVSVVIGFSPFGRQTVQNHSIKNGQMLLLSNFSNILYFNIVSATEREEREGLRHGRGVS